MVLRAEDNLGACEVKLAKAWYDNPDREYAECIENAMESFRSGKLSGSDVAVIRAEAERCRDYVKTVSKR